MSFNAIYTWTFDPGSLAVSGTYVWKDKTYDSVFNRSYSLMPAYSQVNLHATWTDTQNRYSVVAFWDNVFNTTGYENAAGALITPNAVTPEVIQRNLGLTAPTTFGVEFQYRWR